MIKETKYFIMSENAEVVEKVDDVKLAKSTALRLTEENDEPYIVFKATSIWYTEPPEEIPARIHKITK